MQQSNFLVIGSGIAGLMFALNAAKHGSVIIISKEQSDEGSTRYAQGGIAAVSTSTDSFDKHSEDTCIAGAGLCDSSIVNLVVREAADRINDLVRFGTKFDCIAGSQDFELGREGGHSDRRILHAGDMTGLRIQEALLEQAQTHPNITIQPHHVAVDLIRNTNSEGETTIYGAYTLEGDESAIVPYIAATTVIATGGAGKIYLITSNPDIATGDGIAMAYRAGARIGNMEFFQFHPTCLYHPLAKSFLITEAMRGEGAKLLTLDGTQFMKKYHPDGELAPRDIVARAIDNEMKVSGSRHVLLDISHRDADFIRTRFPTVYRETQKFGFDLTRNPIPVVPAAHYCCGGIVTDLNGHTDLNRLYAVGEAAYTGLHGANRLASNSLLEAAVFGVRAAEHAVSTFQTLSETLKIQPWDHIDSVNSPEKVIVSHLWNEVRLTMWNLVGIVRSTNRLSLALKRITNLKAEVQDYYWKYRITCNLIELRNVIQVAELVIRSALDRKESRGLHYTTDFPERDDVNFLKPTVITDLHGKKQP